MESIILSQNVPWWERERDVKHGDTCDHMNVWRKGIRQHRLRP